MQAGLVDVSDWPLTPALITSLGGNNGFFVTPQIASHDYDELEFHNGNNFWGCDFSFTNSACGIDIRQGIAHLLDKNILTTTQADIAGVSLPIDNALPPSLGLPTPNPCAWDALFPQSGPACVVGAAGGLAYHLAAATRGLGLLIRLSLGLQDWVHLTFVLQQTTSSTRILQQVRTRPHVSSLASVALLALTL